LKSARRDAKAGRETETFLKLIMAKENIIDLSQSPNPLPKVGDMVAFVDPGNRIVQGKVASVDAKSDGRAITVEGVAGRDKKPLRVVYRPKAALAGNTWHWPLALLVLLACLAIALALPARAALPTYHTFSGYGNSSAPATIIMPADPNSQIRIVSMFYTSDNAAGLFSFSSGSTAFSVSYSNTLSSVTNYLDSTNGLSTGSQLVLQHGGIDYTNAVSNWGTFPSGTNTSGYVTNQAWVVTPSAFSLGSATVSGNAGDNIYLMTTPQNWFVGATTNALNGDDIFSGNYGRPVIVQLGPATSTNRLNSVSAHYDSASQY
jgi:hypothetical protein